MKQIPAANRSTARGSGVGRLISLIVLVCAVALPFWFSSYHVFQATQILIFAIVLMGLNLLVGYSGQISLGHGAFYGLGAYIVAVLMARYDLSFYATIPVVAVVCFAAGFVFGLPALRLQGLYLALATFALAVAFPQLLSSDLLETVTGGVQGLSVIKPEAPFGLPLTADQWMYVLVASTASVLYLIARNLARSAVGRSLAALRDNPVAAATMGINLALYKTFAFATSAAYAGVGGALAAATLQFVAPDSFSALLSISFLVGLMIGGVGSMGTTVFGAAFIMLVPNLTDMAAKSLTGAVYGTILILFIYFLPGGVSQIITAITGLAAGWRLPRAGAAESIAPTPRVPEV